MWRPTISSDEIWHHGIQGMHWGQRNGPPYPLDQKTHNSVVKGTSTGAGKGTKGDVESVNKEGDKARRGRIVANLLLSTVWPLRMVDVVLDTREEIAEVSRKRLRKKADEDRMTAPVDKKTGLKKQDPPKSDLENMRRVNIDYYSNPKGNRQNCTNCTMAMELRLRGFEVEAQPTETGRNGVDFAKKMFPKSKNTVVQTFPDPVKERDEFYKYMRRESPKAQLGMNNALAKKAITQLKTEPPGSRGQLLITWGMSGGHSVMYRITDKGKVEVWDTQVNKVYNESQTKNLIKHTVAVQYQRLDNLEFNKKNIREAVR